MASEVNPEQCMLRINSEHDFVVLLFGFDGLFAVICTFSLRLIVFVQVGMAYQSKICTSGLAYSHTSSKYQLGANS